MKANKKARKKNVIANNEKYEIEEKKCIQFDTEGNTEESILQFAIKHKKNGGQLLNIGVLKHIGGEWKILRSISLVPTEENLSIFGLEKWYSKPSKKLTEKDLNKLTKKELIAYYKKLQQ